MNKEYDKLFAESVEHERRIQQILGRALHYPENQSLPEIGGLPGDTSIQTFDDTSDDLAVYAASYIDTLEQLLQESVDANRALREASLVRNANVITDYESQKYKLALAHERVRQISVAIAKLVDGGFRNSSGENK